MFRRIIHDGANITRNSGMKKEMTDFFCKTVWPMPLPLNINKASQPH